MSTSSLPEDLLVKVLVLICASDPQETMMDHPLRTISYIADIGNIVVLMARRRMPRPDSQENVEASDPGQESRRQYKMICHVFESEDVSICLRSWCNLDS